MDEATQKLKEKLKSAEGFKKRLAASEKDNKRKHALVVGK
jgi:hypothetical protein